MKQEEMAKLAQLIITSIRSEPIPVRIIRNQSPRLSKRLPRAFDSIMVKRREDTRRVIHEINRRHRIGQGSYPRIICSMMHDSVWGARMRHRNANTWRSKAIAMKAK